MGGYIGWRGEIGYGGGGDLCDDDVIFFEGVFGWKLGILVIGVFIR